ncbi:hypothetical protein MKZ38_002950 [Zalerion maritima]|uniref:RanBD1 domain-containing protein n=1 Tax=Zalerion maritima TaxID=339359 RepID=A0AAD5RN96_9PEZI|nr:hypothetical protein MKZ38_002950 [Zalerion maritima]
MEPSHGTPRSRFASTLGSMGTPARRAPGTPLSARRSLDRSTRGPSPFSSSANNPVGTPKNIFRASMAGDRMRHSFTPRASSTLRQAHSPAPPSSTRSFRGSTMTPAIASATKPSSIELFNQTIDDPPASLDGEALMNQVPDDPHRQGSVYADDFLAHTCPPGLDDPGRRQWFCILDLRRLKYAANELFAKKDWKINISNFAKEYEKSRGLIMLRYGLYEFQTIKPTDEQLKKWRKDHDIPDPEEEDTPARRAQTGASKRKAEDDMPLSTSTSNKNKRRQTEPDAPLTKGKRRAVSDSDQDEHQPSKLQKSNTPSASLSTFMKVASGVSVSQPTSLKPGSNLFGAKTAVEPAKSILSDPKAANASSPNLFEYLSDASRAPSVNNADASEESAADSDDEDTEGKDASEPSVSASGGVGTPADREGTPSQNLFDRITKDKDGKPVRASEPETSKTASFSPSNQTWNTNTPIKFSGTSNPFGVRNGEDAAEKPAPFQPMFGAKQVEEPKALPTPETSTPPGPAATAPTTCNLFGASSKAPEAEAESKPVTKGDSAPAPTQNIYNSLGKPSEPTEAPKPTSSGLFGLAAAAKAPSTTSSSGLFGAAPEVNGTKTPATAASTNISSQPPSTLLGAMPAETTGAPKAGNLFGSRSPLAAEKPATPAFGASAPSTGEACKPLFESGNSSTASKPLFGSAPAPAEDKSKSVFGNNPAATDDEAKRPFDSASSIEPPAKKLFAGAAKVDDKLAGNLFRAGSAGEDKPKNSLFGGSQQQSTNLFGGSNATSAPSFGVAAPTPDTGADKSKPFSFGTGSSKPAATTAPSTENNPPFSFGGNASQSTALFAGEKKPDAASSSGLFGGSAQTQPSNNTFGGTDNSFGSGQSGTTTPASSFNFGGGSAVNNPFASQNRGGASGGGINFNFGSTPAVESKPAAAAPFMFGGTGVNPPAPAAPAPGGSLFSFGASTPATPPATNSAPSFSFTGATPTGNSNNLFAPQPSALAAPGGTSTGTSSPFNFGGASSLATTPAATTPESTTAADEGSSKHPAATDKPPEEEERISQINLTEGGPGEEDEEVVYNVRCKALKEELETTIYSESEKDSEKEKNGDRKKSKSAWSTKGVGPLRILKHKATGAIRLVLRAEPRGNVVINTVPIPAMPYNVSGKYVVAPFPSESGGLDKWMLMVKTPDAAKALSEAINKYKKVERPE